MINALALMLPIAYTQCDGEGTEVCALVMANCGCSYAALNTFWSSPYHTRHIIPLPFYYISCSKDLLPKQHEHLKRIWNFLHM